MIKNSQMQSEEAKHTSILYDPKFRVIFTWIWFIVGPILTILTVILFMGESIAGLRQALSSHPYITTYVEIVGVGLIPAIFTLFDKEKLAAYGLWKKGLVTSLLLSAVVVAVCMGVSLITTGQPVGYSTVDFQISLPWNYFYGILGIFAYGPLEVFFFVWMVNNTDRAMRGTQSMLSRGLIITVIIFSLMHILTTQHVETAFYIAVIYSALGLIYKRTQNVIGPMIAWTLINGQVWYLAQMMR
jgi:membrane protease YdiL (CAAX protease family)